jgi:hypothetical protein
MSVIQGTNQGPLHDLLRDKLSYVVVAVVRLPPEVWLTYPNDIK